LRRGRRSSFFLEKEIVCYLSLEKLKKLAAFHTKVVGMSTFCMGVELLQKEREMIKMCG
jgi:hypothetical protein